MVTSSDRCVNLFVSDISVGVIIILNRTSTQDKLSHATNNHCIKGYQRTGAKTYKAVLKPHVLSILAILGESVRFQVVFISRNNWSVYN